MCVCVCLSVCLSVYVSVCARNSSDVCLLQLKNKSWTLLSVLMQSGDTEIVEPLH